MLKIIQSVIKNDNFETTLFCIFASQSTAANIKPHIIYSFYYGGLTTRSY